MSYPIFEEQIFEKLDFSAKALPTAEYEGCEFNFCNLSTTDLSNCQFTDCIFISCNLSTAKLNNTAIRDVQFKDCKLLGLRFDDCNDFLFAAKFTNCNLHLSSFYKRKMRQAKFSNCDLHETDFSMAELIQSTFDQCNLAGAVFDATNLEKADFRTSFNFTINPVTNRIKKARFSKDGLEGLLTHLDIIIE